MRRQLTLGVVGHVDHGKTALVEALTGISTDRLDEERARGLSIVLGFAYLETADATVDLVDVPGHEGFVRAMIAGATGIDGVVLVVAANEGVMPQTREHLAIARLLALERGIVVVTKSDLASAEQIAGVMRAIDEVTAGTFLEGAPRLTASTADARSIAAVGSAIESLAREPVQRPAGRGFFLPVDRVFSVKGFGVVVTGTLRGDALRVGDRVAIEPGGRSATVRGLERHSRPATEALPGQRVAVNLRGLERAELARGDVLAAPGAMTATDRLDAELHVIAEAPAPVANGSRVRVLTGTTEALARVRVLDGAALEPGTAGFVQLRLERTIASCPGERYLVRAYSPMRTLGGGRLLDVAPPRHRRFDAAVLGRLQSSAAGDTEALLASLLAEAGLAGIDCTTVAARLGRTPAALRADLDTLGAVAVADARAVAYSTWTALAEEIVARLEAFHAAHPREPGIAAEALRRQLVPAPDTELWRHAVAALERQGCLKLTDDVLRLRGFDPLAQFTAAERALLASIEAEFGAGGLEPPAPAAVIGRDPRAASLYRVLLERGRLVRLHTYARGTEIVLHADTLARVRRELAARYPHPQRFTIAEARDVLKTTRRHVTPLMEHLDATGFTIRIGDVRQLRAS